MVNTGGDFYARHEEVVRSSVEAWGEVPFKGNPNFDPFNKTVPALYSQVMLPFQAALGIEFSASNTKRVQASKSLGIMSCHK